MHGDVPVTACTTSAVDRLVEIETHRRSPDQLENPVGLVVNEDEPGPWVGDEVAERLVHAVSRKVGDP